MQRYFSTLPHSAVYKANREIAFWCQPTSAANPAIATSPIAVQNNLPAQPRWASQELCQQALAALQGSLITLDEQLAHSLELTATPTPQLTPWLSGRLRSDRHALNMEIQPAAQDAQREETVVMIRQDSGESTHHQPPSNGTAEATPPERHTTLLPRGMVETVDGDRVPAHVAQALCRKSEQQQLQFCCHWAQSILCAGRGGLHLTLIRCG